MKVELLGINLEDVYGAPNTPNGELPVTLDEPRRMVMATLGNRTERHYSSIRVPIEALGDAKVGDEFTLYLERVKK